MRFLSIAPFIGLALIISGCANTTCIMASKDGFEAQRKGDLPEAEACFKKAVLACKNDASSATTVDSLTNLGKVYFAEKKYELAASTMEEVRKLWGHFADRANENKVTILNMLGQSYQELQKYDRAEPVLKEALTAAENQSGDNGPNIAKTLISLGGLYKAEGKFEKALDAYQRGQAILNRSANITEETSDTLDKNIADVFRHIKPNKPNELNKPNKPNKKLAH